MTKVSQSLHTLIHNLTWEKEWFEEDISEKELNQLAKLSELIQNKYNQSLEKKTLLGNFKSSNYEYLKQIDAQREESKYIARTKDGKTLLYARFDDSYRINPTNALDYVDQYKTKL